LRECDESRGTRYSERLVQKDASRPTGKPEPLHRKRPITSLASSSVRASMSGTGHDSLAANDELRDNPLR